MATGGPKPTDNVRVSGDDESRVQHNGGLKVPYKVWYKDAGLRKLYFMMPILMLGSTINGYDGSLLNGLQTMEPWRAYFNYPQGHRLGLYTAIQNIGGAVALFFSSYIADKFGRRWGVTLGVTIVIVGSVIQAVPSVNESMFLAGRFLVGFGSNFAQAALPLLITELAYPQHRGKLTTAYNVQWYLGAIIAAWTIYGMVDYDTDVAWRVPVALQAAMPVVQLCGIWFFPESPRWLCAKGQTDKALQILAKYKYHANGDDQDPFVQAELREINETIRFEREVAAESGWLLLVKTPGNRKRLMLLALVGFFSQCSGNGLVSYYLHAILLSIGIESSHDQALINGAVQIWSFLVALCFSVLLVDKLGRKTLFMIAGVGMLISFSIWTACSAVYEQSQNAAAGSAVIAMIFLFYGVAGFAWPGLTVGYSAEIMPFETRAKGLALSFGFQAISSVINQYVNPVGLEELQWKFYFVYIAILVIECFCIWFLFVETKGPTLEEIAELFDGPKAHVPHNLDQKADDTGVSHVEK
ncbi:hypothetical protein ACHAQA_002099 [Verticillium albo-atrum]